MGVYLYKHVCVFNIELEYLLLNGTSCDTHDRWTHKLKYCVAVKKKCYDLTPYINDDFKFLLSVSVFAHRSRIRFVSVVNGLEAWMIIFNRTKHAFDLLGKMVCHWSDSNLLQIWKTFT